MSTNLNNINNNVIINWNANSIKRNRNTFAAFLSHHNVDIACICKTHLCTTDSIKFNGYSIYRNDRKAVRNSGGIALLILLMFLGFSKILLMEINVVELGLATLNQKMHYFMYHANCF
jgi:hypothetical protein